MAWRRPTHPLLRAEVGGALEKIRREQRPIVVEIPTYRYYGAHVADSNFKKYRTPEEIEMMKGSRDPIALWLQQLSREGILDEQSAQSIKEEAKLEAKKSVTFAEASEPPAVDDVMTNVYWESDHGTPASKIGRHFFD